MNISQKIILPAIAVILIQWWDLNAQTNTDKWVQPQPSLANSELISTHSAI
ncbi:MAG: hypothetical protein AAFQ41_03450 [Cyanobacteria bacterium J06623_7]